ncbi:MAG: cytochrome c, partial [Bryobacteraceae bacterium]
MRTVFAALSALIAFASLAVAQPTYSNEISRIFRAKCEQCHREGDIAPFALKDYDTAVAWSEDIKRVLSTNKMPPWKPEPGIGEFRNNFSLTDEEKQAIFAWIDNGTPQGDPADLLEAPEAKSEWPLGQPDLDLRMLQTFTPARGKDVYRCFVIPTGLDSTRFLSAIDVLPGNRSIVHHVLLYQDTQGVTDKLDGQDGQPGYDC